MRLEPAALAAFVSIALAAVVPAAAPELGVDDQVEVGLMQLYVTVTDRAGRRVVDLEASDFVIRDAAVEERIVTLAGGEVPFTAVILVDGSSSLSGPGWEAAKAGARAFLGGMATFDESAIRLFADRLRLASPWSEDGAALAAFLEGIEPGGGTALYDHLYLALRELLDRLGRRVVVLLTDGTDAHSVLDLGAVGELARFGHAQIYWVAVPGALPRRGAPWLDAWNDAAGRRRERETLEELVAASGGRVLPVEGPEGIAAAFAEILTEIRQQVAIGYYPTLAVAPGRWRRVEVEVRRPGLRARAIGGYVQRLPPG